MSKIIINRILVNISTDKGIFGQQVTFKTGLNIIRAENTSGKSSLINSILYCLGLERLLSNRTGPAALKPVLKTQGTYSGGSFKVLESYAIVEVTNHEGKKASFRRQIIGEEDTNLVRVYDNWILSETHTDPYEYYYLNLEGSAQREKGFHKYLQNYLGLELPFVPKYQGNDVPLYLECIFPLMFIEQIHGWVGIQHNTPKIFGIQNVNKTVLEYFLALDVQANIKKKNELVKENDRIIDLWININTCMVNKAREYGSYIKGIIEKPQVEMKDNEQPQVFITKDTKEYSIEEYIVYLRDALLEIKEAENIIADEKRFNEINEEIEKMEISLTILYSKQREITNLLSKREYEQEESRNRIEKIKKEINKHKDLIRIISLGGSLSNELLNHICPVCKQTISDSLVSDIKQPMTIEDNLIFLNQQKDCLVSIILDNSKIIDIEKSKKEVIRKDIEQLQKKIIALKSDVYRTSGLSEASIREKVGIENQISGFTSLVEYINSKYEEQKKVAEEYRLYKIEVLKMPKELFSENDLIKINRLKGIFEKLLVDYGFKSTAIQSIDISKDNYLPVSCQEGFELSLDSSASDSIRIIWAYTIALLLLSQDYSINHLGIVILDEPEQQQMKKYSSKILYKSISENISTQNQCIITTSESKEELEAKISDLSINYIELGDTVFVPNAIWNK
jgi:hypothetical protein